MAPSLCPASIRGALTALPTLAVRRFPSTAGYPRRRRKNSSRLVGRWAHLPQQARLSSLSEQQLSQATLRSAALELLG